MGGDKTGSCDKYKTIDNNMMLSCDRACILFGLLIVYLSVTRNTLDAKCVHRE